MAAFHAKIAGVAFSLIILSQDRQRSHPRITEHTMNCAPYFQKSKKTSGGRPQHPQWSFQHNEVLLMQRIDKLESMGSYSTGQMSIRFHGFRLEKVERNGWIFSPATNSLMPRLNFSIVATNGTAVANSPVPTRAMASKSSTRVILHAGDSDQYPSFAVFQESILENQLQIKTNKITYQYGKDKTQIEWWRYDPHNFKRFKLPRVNQQKINLRPDWTFDSPFMKSQFQKDEVHINVGPIRQVYNFSLGL